MLRSVEQESLSALQGGEEREAPLTNCSQAPPSLYVAFLCCMSVFSSGVIAGVVDVVRVDMMCDFLVEISCERSLVACEVGERKGWFWRWWVQRSRRGVLLRVVTGVEGFFQMWEWGDD